MGFKTLNQVDVTDGTVQLVDGTLSHFSYVSPQSKFQGYDAYHKIMPAPNPAQTIIAIYIWKDQISSLYHNRHRIPTIHCSGRNGRRRWRLGLSACLHF